MVPVGFNSAGRGRGLHIHSGFVSVGLTRPHYATSCVCQRRRPEGNGVGSPGTEVLTGPPLQRV